MKTQLLKLTITIRLIPVLVWALLFLALPRAAEAQFTVATNNGTITITGYTGPNGALAIPDTIYGLPVTAIGDSAFADQTGLTSVTIPSCILTISNGAFSHCNGLTDIVIGDGVLSIGDGAFDGCTSLTCITIPANVTNIGCWAFFECASLSNITVNGLNGCYSSVDGILFDHNRTTLIHYPWNKIEGDYTTPDSVTSIGDYAFYACPSLTSIVIGDSVTNIGNRAFYACTYLKNVSIGNGVGSIGELAFYTCPALTNVVIGSNVSSIGYAAFHSCGNLVSITIPAGVTNIGNLAFYACSRLANLTIPESVTGIGEQAFCLCAALTSVTIPASVTDLGDEAFSNCYGLKRATIGDGLTRIGYKTFDFCLGLTTVTIGKKVTAIDYQAFGMCVALTSVYFRGNAPSSVDSTAFYHDDSAIIYYLPGATGWRSTLAGRPTVLWNPQINTADLSFGVQTNRFGFKITGNNNLVIVVEATDSLVNPVWSAVGTNMLIGGSSYFSDTKWTNYPSRFYRLRSP